LFKLISAILIMVAFLNAALCLFTTNSAYETIDQVFINIFFIELIVTIIAIGP
jgi:hypothetical protein